MTGRVRDQQSERTDASLGVIVVNYASHELLRQNLGAVDLVNAQVVVVDNFSNASERTAVEALASERGWTLVARPDNPGFGAGVNAGVAAAQLLGCCGYLLLNPDVAITAATVEELRSNVIRDTTALVSPALTDLTGARISAEFSLDLADGRNRSALAVRVDPTRQLRPVTWLTAACLAVPAPLWAAVGGMAENYFMYWEDVDFNMRCRSHGARTIVRDDLTAVHDQGGTQGTRRGRAKSGLYYYFNARNRMLFARLHLGHRDLLQWWIRTPLISYELWLHGGRRQILESPSGAFAAARGGLVGMAIALLPVSRARTPPR